MSDDIRLQSDWYQNPKIKKLAILIGAQGIVSLLTLWAWTGKNRPNGILHDMDELDVVLAANWPNDTTLFIDSLLRLKLLDEGDWYSIHDWERNQPWALHTDARKAAAKKAADVRWGKEKNRAKVSTLCEPHENLCESHDSACETHESAMRNQQKPDAPFLSLPSPSPSPSQEKDPPTPRKRGKIEKSNEFDLSVIVLPDWMPEEPWQQFVLHRERIKVPMTPHAAKLMIGKLLLAKNNGWSPEELLNEAIISGKWKDCVFDKHKLPRPTQLTAYQGNNGFNSNRGRIEPSPMESFTHPNNEEQTAYIKYGQNIPDYSMFESTKESLSHAA